MKNSQCLVTLCYNDFNTIKDYMIKRLKQYCYKHKYDFICLDAINNTEAYPFSKLQCFNLLSQYSNFLFIDMDIYISNIDLMLNTNINNTLSFMAKHIEYVRSCIFGCNNSLGYYDILNTNSIKCETLNYKNDYDEEAYLTDVTIQHNIKRNIIVPYNKCYETDIKTLFMLPNNIELYDILYFDGYNYHHMLQYIPQILNDINNNVSINKINQKICQLLMVKK